MKIVATSSKLLSINSNDIDQIVFVKQEQSFYSLVNYGRRGYSDGWNKVIFTKNNTTSTNSTTLVNLPIASAKRLGGIKVGFGFSILPNGTLNNNAYDYINHPITGYVRNQTELLQPPQTIWGDIQLNGNIDITGAFKINGNPIISFPGFGTTHVLAAYGNHVHGNITNTGYIGTTANLPLITGVNGIIQTGTFGTTVNTFCIGNDSRLSDARTPLSHTHGNITNDGKIGSTSGLPVVTGTSGVLTVGVTQTPQNLGDTLSGSVTMDSANGFNAYGTLTGNITAFIITNVVAGDSGVIELTQGGSGGYTLTTTMTKEGGTLALSTAVETVDVIGWYYNGTSFRLNVGKAYA